MWMILWTIKIQQKKSPNDPASSFCSDLFALQVTGDDVKRKNKNKKAFQPPGQ